MTGEIEWLVADRPETWFDGSRSLALLYDVAGDRLQVEESEGG